MNLLSRVAIVLVSAVLILLSLAGCLDLQTPAEQRGTLYHPVPDSIALRSGSSLVVPMEVASEASFPGSVRALLARVPAVTVGVEDGEPEQLIGSVADGLLFSDDAFAVLDIQVGELRIFGMDGVLRFSIGEPGEGPGEFMRPGYLLRPSPDRLWVLDRIGAVHFFEVEEDGLEFERRRITIPTAPRGGA